MPRVVSLYLPFFPTDLLRRSFGRPPSSGPDAAPSADREAPLVTAIRVRSRRLVASVDRAAWGAGIRPGHPVAQAKASLPGLRIAEATPEQDGAVLVEVAAWCLRATPVVQADPPDGVLLDVEGCAHLAGGERALLDDLLARLRTAGFAAEGAVAATPGAAWALARERPGEIVGPGGTETALKDLPVAALRLDPETVRGLRILGIARIGDLLRLPRPALARRFGDALLDRSDRVLGRRADPLTPLMPVAMPEARRAFAEPLTHPEGIAAALAWLAGALCRELDQRRIGLRRLDAILLRVDGCPLGLQVGTTSPSRDPAHIGRLLAERLPTLDPGFGIDEIRLVASRVEPLGERQLGATGLADTAADGEDCALAPLVDRLVVRLGASRIYRAGPVESHVPERSVAALAPLSRPPASRSASWPACLPRPSRLIDPPEPVSALAVVPDEPPASFVWRRVRHVVRAADGPERVRGEWWRSDREVDWLRDYYRVENQAGQRFWLFRDAPMAEGGRWWLHGRFA